MSEVSVVRLRTETFKRGNRYYRSRVITPLSRKSTFDMMHEECQAVGTDEVFERIVNVDRVPDGLYNLTICNVGRDWETGQIEEYDLKLIPYED